ncbi:MAG TPA: tyrosine-type recombinase/integrase [Flavobacterium sp.]|nr:tyrosine-type recombinase/integrase [Flavobacterium sp.]HRZ75193.1 tyrosine-type recombinase/integrase [Flavobacterium sp.]
MNLKFFIVEGKKKYTSIHVRFWDSKRIDQKTKTGITVSADDWSSSKQRLKPKATTTNRDFLNHQLEQVERYVIDKYNLDYNSKKFISEKWLKETIENFFGRVTEDNNYKIYFVDWVELFVKEAPKRMYNGKPIAERTIKNYTTTLNKLKAFEKVQNHKYRFEDIDLNFHRDFIHYSSTVEKLNNNSIGSLITRIKTFCSNIELDGYSINPKYKHRDFKAPSNETKDIYLNEEEINKIAKHDFSDKESLDNARDLFIIGLRTGLRVSDFLRIGKENVIDNIINITTQKTNQNLYIPIHPQFQEVLNKRNGEFPREISDQKFNLYIKTACEEVGLKEMVFGAKINPETNRKEFKIYPKHELVTSHICRRSFATNLFLAGFDNSTIMKATGHQSEAQFLKYIKASQTEHLQKISAYWENNKK